MEIKGDKNFDLAFEAYYLSESKNEYIQQLVFRLLYKAFEAGWDAKAKSAD